MLKNATLAILATFGVTASGATLLAQAPVYPGVVWPHAVSDHALDRLGWDSDRLKKTRKYLRRNSNASGIVVVDRGRVVFEYGNVAELSYVASVRKSILAVLYGTHVDRGTIRLSRTLSDLGIDDVQGLSRTEKRASIEHLLTARSGIYHPASNRGDHTTYAPARNSQRPGSFMLYNNWDFNTAGAVFEKLTRRNIYDELERQLAIPLQFQDWSRGQQRKSGNRGRSNFLAYHMHLSTRDMARIGYLMLRKGAWDGRQLVPSEWIQKITSPATPVGRMNPRRLRKGKFGYGYMWWVWDGFQARGAFEGAFTANGAYGQWITVLPARDLVIAHKTLPEKGKSTSEKVYYGFVDRLLKAQQKPTPTARPGR